MHLRTPWILACTLALAGCPTSDRGAPAPDTGADTDTDSGGVDTGVPAVCPDYEGSPLGACLAWDGAAPEGFATDSFVVTVAGTVEAVGVGAPPVGCAYADALVDHAPLGNVDRLAEADAAWVTVVDAAGERWTLAWHLPGVGAPAVGAAVTLDVAWSRGFAETRGEVRLLADAALVGWLASASALTSLDLPEGLTVAEGAPVCVEGSTCEVTTIHRLDVSEGASTSTLAPGDGADLVSLHVTLGESVTYVSTGECEDGAASSFQLGVVPM